MVVADPSGAVAPVSEDPQILARLQPMLASVAAQLDEVVGTAPALLDGERPHVRAGDTNLAFLVTDAFRAAGGSELAFAIGGGIRSSIAAGEITYREVLTALPFGNGLVRGKLSGAQVLEVLGLGARQVAPAGGWLQVSGLTWTIAGGEAREVRIGGAALDPARLYSVTCDRFIADGGERYAHSYYNAPWLATRGFDIAAARAAVHAAAALGNSLPWTVAEATRPATSR